MTEWVLFDMDGTLINSMPIWKNIASDFVRGNGGAPEGDLYPVLYGRTLEESSRTLCDMFSLSLTDEEAFESMISLVEEKYKTVEQTRGAYALLEALHDRNIKLAVVSACPYRLVVPTLERLGFTKFLDKIYYSTDKSTPEAFITLSQKLGYDPKKTWLVEDNLTAMVAAAKIGIKTAALFDGSSRASADEFKQKTDRFYTDFADLDSWLADIL